MIQLLYSQTSPMILPPANRCGKLIRLMGLMGLMGLIFASLALSPAVASAQNFRPIEPPATPPALPDEMETLFKAMEDSLAASQKVFEPLTTEQMNFRPANGSHTPRWNVEHLGGRQAQFFSELFHAVNPDIPVINVNPKQMPEDYKFAHPERTGAEEAQWMGQVNDYCRRYAYLLADMDLDAKPPAGRWPSLRKLLTVMDRHYDEHTGNVVKKFDLPGFPSGVSSKNKSMGDDAMDDDAMDDDAMDSGAKKMAPAQSSP